MIKFTHLCFYTNGAIHHNYGGLDRVTENLTTFFEEYGIKVTFLSIKKREWFDQKRQFFLPDEKNIHSKENRLFFNNFIRDKKIDVIINQEGNVNIHIPLDKELQSKVVYITALHFNPNYIPDDYFKYRIEQINASNIIKHLITKVFECNTINKIAINYLRHKLAKNYKYQIKNSDSFVLLSNRFKTDLSYILRQTHLPNNIKAINNLTTYKPINELPAKKNQVLYVGRLVCSHKRIDKLLEIWQKVSLKFNDWELIIVGDGPDKAFLQEKSRTMGIESNVRFVGLSNNPKQFYQDASIFCFTSSATEGWGLVLVEAQTYGCIPICYDSYSSLSDIIDDGVTGYLISQDNEQEYIQKLETMLNDAALRRKMAEACIKSTHKFHPYIIGNQWIKLINNLIEYKSQKI